MKHETLIGPTGRREKNQIRSFQAPLSTDR